MKSATALMLSAAVTVAALWGGTAIAGDAAAAQPATQPYVYKPNPTIPAPDGVPATITSPLGKNMSLKFDDEFNAVTDKDGQPYIDRSKWQTTFWQGSSQRTLWANGEAQYYMDKDYGGRGEVPRSKWFNPFSFEEPGILTISATKVPKEYWHNWWMGEQRPFSSGLLISDHKFSFKYGYMEGRFKLPGVRGAWPAFWILGDDPSKAKPDEQHAWGPEVDAFEFFGHRPTKHSAGIIGAKKEKLTGWHFGYNEVGFDISQDYHTWGFEWDDKKCVWTFDGKQWAWCDTPASMNRPMYLLVNLAVGGNWYMQEMKAKGTPYHQWEVDEASMPWKMKCDYVRVYQAEE